ncbi:MAG: L-serine ammonia-lyase, iron-sulfur-dependent, subunit alpha [Eubacteriales bacterium]|nr:L-serine ammonia-lyase, iron-sulfur-dependent, subunit alpha [Eubacteriales bacterium]
MHPLTELIHSDMKPALGVTEPGAIAFAVSTAGSYLTGEIQEVSIALNSGMYKNAFTCGIPGSPHYGNLYAAALGAVAGKPELGLMSLQEVTEADNLAAENLVKENRIHAEMSEVSSRIHIVATVRKESGAATVTIWDTHTGITSIEVNGEMVKETSADKVSGRVESADASFGEAAETSEPPLIHRYTLGEMLDYVRTVPAEEIAFIQEAFEMNLALFREGLANPRTTYLHYLWKKNGEQEISEDELASASLLCNGAIEARVIGLDAPAMSITGSGAHGIIATLPLYASAEVRGISDEMRNRMTALSYLICMYIKEYSGRLSAFCGCAIAAGSGMAAALCFGRGGGEKEITACLWNMASSITGMVCDGGNHGCTMKGVVACDAAFRAADLAMNGISIEPIHGINGATAEETMRNMGQIASPGMVATEKTIVDIMQEK